MSDAKPLSAEEVAALENARISPRGRIEGVWMTREEYNKMLATLKDYERKLKAACDALEAARESFVAMDREPRKAGILDECWDAIHTIDVALKAAKEGM